MIDNKQLAFFMAQLNLLRRALVQCVTVIGIIFAILLYYSRPLYHLFALPLMQHLPQQTLIATQIIAPIVVPLKFAYYLSLYVAMPFILWMLWRFVAPGLYQRERYFIWPLMVLSIVLFYAGILFGYILVCPVLFAFVTAFTPQGVVFMPDISDYLSFTMQFCFNFGLAFEVPVAMMILVRAGIVDYRQLKAWRRYFIVLAFVIGMLLTPPDVMSQLLLAIPLCLLYELGLWLARGMQKKTAVLAP